MPFHVEFVTALRQTEDVFLYLSILMTPIIVSTIANTALTVRAMM